MGSGEEEEIGWDSVRRDDDFSLELDEVVLELELVDLSCSRHVWILEYLFDETSNLKMSPWALKH